jgi:hypothetical protein
MSLSHRATIGLACLVLGAAAARADQPASPLHFLPEKTDVVVEVLHPRQLVEALTNFDTIKQLEQLGVSKELLNSTQYRRFYQLVAYFEKELGAKWPELLDNLAGRGAALGIKFAPDPAPAVLVIQGKDEKLTRRFVELAVKVIEQEIARQDSQDKLVKEEYEGIEMFHVPNAFHAAVNGTAIILSNNPESLKAALNQSLGKEKASLADVAAVADSRKLLPKDPLAALWLNMETVRESPQGKEFYKRPRDLNLTILFGGLIDVLSRTPYIAAGLYQEKDGFLVTLRTPKGREGMGPESLLHLAPEGQPATRPTLEPRGVIYSESFYLNVARLWDDRKEFLGEKQAKDFEDFDKRSAPFLSGIKASKLMHDVAAYHRVVVVNQPKAGYKTTPKTNVPAFAVVSEMRDPDEFSNSISTVLRGAALLFSTTQTKMTLVEEKHGDVTLVGYRFPEGTAYKPDVNDIRFNFSPCFVRVGNQFVVSSTLELGHELVDLLQNEAAGANKGEKTSNTQRFFGSGMADLLQLFEDQLITQMILDQAMEPADAKAQVRDFIGIIRRMGSLSIQSEYQKNEFRYDFRLKTAK